MTCNTPTSIHQQLYLGLGCLVECHRYVFSIHLECGIVLIYMHNNILNQLPSSNVLCIAYQTVHYTVKTPRTMRTKSWLQFRKFHSSYIVYKYTRLDCVFCPYDPLYNHEDKVAAATHEISTTTHFMLFIQVIPMLQGSLCYCSTSRSEKQQPITY